MGRNLQGHVYAGTVALFDEIVQDCAGPGPRIATNDYRHHNEGIVGGAMIANDFVPAPLFTWSLLGALGAIPAWGAASKQGMRELYSRMAMVMGPVQEMPNPSRGSRLTPECETGSAYLLLASAAACTRRTARPPPSLPRRRSRGPGQAGRKGRFLSCSRQAKDQAAASTRRAPAAWAAILPPQ